MYYAAFFTYFTLEKWFDHKIPCVVIKFHGFSRFSMGAIKFHGFSMFSRFSRLVDTMNLVWENTFTNHLYNISKLQKHAVRIICQAPFRSHSEPLFKSLNILTLADVHKYQVLIYMYKHHSATFQDFSNHGYSTRNRTNLRSSFRRKVLSRRSISCIGPSFWTAHCTTSPT